MHVCLGILHEAFFIGTSIKYMALNKNKHSTGLARDIFFVIFLVEPENIYISLAFATSYVHISLFPFPQEFRD